MKISSHKPTAKIGMSTLNLLNSWTMYSPEYCVKPRPAKKPGTATITKYYTV